MPATDTTIWDYVVTYGGPSLFMTAVFVVVMPLVYFNFARPRYTRWPSRLAVMLTVWLGAWLVAYGDVLWIAREAKRVCETEAGLRVYRTAEAEGFEGFPGVNEWVSIGFRFTEYMDLNGKITRYRIHQGKAISERSNLLKSMHRYKIETSPFSGNLTRRREMIIQVNDNSVLGELITFKPRLGWIDRTLSDPLGANAKPKMCEGPKMISPDKKELSYFNLITSTLKPPKK